MDSPSAPDIAAYFYFGVWLPYVFPKLVAWWFSGGD